MVFSKDEGLYLFVTDTDLYLIINFFVIIITIPGPRPI